MTAGLDKVTLGAQCHFHRFFWGGGVQIVSVMTCVHSFFLTGVISLENNIFTHFNISRNLYKEKQCPFKYFGNYFFFFLSASCVFFLYSITCLQHHVACVQLYNFVMLFITTISDQSSCDQQNVESSETITVPLRNHKICHTCGKRKHLEGKMCSMICVVFLSFLLQRMYFLPYV